MDGGSIERLTVKTGEAATAGHLAQLDRKITQNAGLRARGVFRRQFPWGRHDNTRGEVGIGSAPQFEPDVTFEKDVAEVRWNGPTALIGGVPPTIGDDPAKAPRIFDADKKTGLRPALSVDRTKYNAMGECGIYFKVTVYPSSFVPQYVQPVALKALPPPEPYTAYKLALFLRIRDGAPSYDEADDRALFCGQGFMAVKIKPDGRFEPLWWAKFG